MKYQVYTTSIIAAVSLFFAVASAQERARPSGSGRHVTVPSSQVVNDDYFAFGESVEISATVVGIPLGLTLLAAFFILLYWSRIYAIARIGEAILARLRPASSRAAAFVLGLFVYYLLALIPFIGWLLVPLLVLFGIGSELIARKQFYVTARSQELL